MSAIRIPPKSGDVQTHLDYMDSFEIPKQGPDDLLMWDSNWMHRGTGNHSNSIKIALHLVFITNVDVCNPEAMSEVDRVYNDGLDHNDPTSPVGQWLFV